MREGKEPPAPDRCCCNEAADTPGEGRRLGRLVLVSPASFARPAWIAQAAASFAKK
jgi:hypothetical protein